MTQKLFLDRYKMPMRLRLAMHGRAHQRIFHLVAVNQRARRNAKPAEILGIYNPHVPPDAEHKTVEWSVDRIRYWLHVGAVPSKSVVKLLELVSIAVPSNLMPFLICTLRETSSSPARYIIRARSGQHNQSLRPRSPRFAKGWQLLKPTNNDIMAFKVHIF